MRIEVFVCDHCNLTISRGEGYVQTDDGSFKLIPDTSFSRFSIHACCRSHGHQIHLKQMGAPRSMTPDEIATYERIDVKMRQANDGD